MSTYLIGYRLCLESVLSDDGKIVTTTLQSEEQVCSMISAFFRLSNLRGSFSPVFVELFA